MKRHLTFLEHLLHLILSYRFMRRPPAPCSPPPSSPPRTSSLGTFAGKPVTLGPCCSSHSYSMVTGFVTKLVKKTWSLSWSQFGNKDQISRSLVELLSPRFGALLTPVLWLKSVNRLRHSIQQRFGYLTNGLNGTLVNNMVTNGHSDQVCW